MDAAGRYTILVDGYNVIKRHGAWDRLPLAEGRRRLVQLLADVRWPVPRPRIIIVFDGPEAGQGSGGGGVQVRFAAPSADADIQDAIRTSRSPQRLIVISDDGEILRTAKSHGVTRYPGRWLFARRAATTTRHPHDAPDTIDLPAATARRITDELAARWLKPSP
jgi:predicted RNA-binding protein with PIN domain